MGVVVEVFAGVGLLATALLLSFDERLLMILDVSLVVLMMLVEMFRMWVDDFEVLMLVFLGLLNFVVDAFSVSTWGVYIFSFVEWLFAMGLIWDYVECDCGDDKGWCMLMWGMFLLYVSGICVCM